jgi:hypothetical protein
MKLVLAAGLALGLTAAVAAVEDTKLGAGVTLNDATPIASIVKAPQDYVGKKVRIDGVATAVCEAMGCWMAVADSAKKDAPTIRLKVEHEGAIVFPMSAKGKHVSAEGTFEAIGGSDEHAKEAAHEHAKADATASTQYQITASGAVIHP